MDDELWTRLVRAGAIDERSCPCGLAGAGACSRHLEESPGRVTTRTARAAGVVTGAQRPPGAARTGARRVALLTVVLTGVSLAVGLVGAGLLAPLVRTSGGAGDVMVELPPFSLSTPARVGLLLVAIACLAGGLSLGLTPSAGRGRRARLRSASGTPRRR